MRIRTTPDRQYAELFEAVQTSRILGDSKTFVDAVAKSDPAEILDAYRSESQVPGFDLSAFVVAHFDLPPAGHETDLVPAGLPVREHIQQLWDYLTRGADERVEHSSLLPLPNRYVVPGGRFREVYYWDSYFTMLGLAESGRIGLIREMVENFSHLIDEVGFIPNGNRSYYCTRSQPPYFALMVDLLAEVTGDDSVYIRYLPQLKREYAFWMADSHMLDGKLAVRRVVMGPYGLLNRYWDEATTPRQESYAEDVAHAETLQREKETLYRDFRAGAESGWDYSSRWFEDQQSLSTITTTQVVPVDLNALLYNLEETLARACEQSGDHDAAVSFGARAKIRKKQIQSIFFDEASGLFTDLRLSDFEPTGAVSIATAYPLFFGLATPEQAKRVATRIRREFLKSGGWVTSISETGQQWDSPNGWAPMQWITYKGLRRYGFDEEAITGATRWVDNNLAIYEAHGCLLEKYNVVEPGIAGSGGEYEVQQGFGWTNAVLLCFMKELEMDA